MVTVRDCVFCDTALYAGDEVTKYGGYLYCNDRCLMADLLKSGEVREVVLRCTYEKCGHRFSDDRVVLYDGMLFCHPDEDECLLKYLRGQKQVTTGYVEEAARHGG
jgi:hypothetical protein